MEITNYEDIEGILKEYHNSLVENGVFDYTWSQFSHDFEMALVEGCIRVINMCNQFKPKTLMKFGSSLLGKDALTLQKTFEKTGAFIKSFLCLTSLYVKDKDNFLISK